MNVSVVIPTHNMADTLPRAVRSALDAGADEIVIVNDASNDTTVHVALSLVGGRVKFYNTLFYFPSGVCFTRNFGIQQARHELIVPLDADDVLLSDALDTLVTAWSPGRFVHGDWLRAQDVGDDDGGRPIYHETHCEAPDVRSLYRKHISPVSFLFARGDWQAVGGFNPTFEAGAEDWAFMAALIDYGVQPVHVAADICKIYVRRDGRTQQCKTRFPLLQTLLAETYPSVFHARADR